MTEPEQARELQDVNILIVDDDDVDVRSVKRGLASIRIANSIYVASDGVEGLAMLRGADGHEAVPRPRLVLLDLNMPRLDGLGFLKELRADPELTETVVFVLTTSQADEDLAATYREHISGYLVKSDAGENLLQTLQLINEFALTVKFPPQL